MDAQAQSDFVVTYPGAFSGHQSNVQVFVGRNQLSYVSPTIKDYDLTLTYLMEQQVTEYTISLTRPVKYGNIVDIIVWPQITQNSPEEQGIVFQSVLVNDSYWLEQGKTIPVRNTVPIYVLGNVGIGTTMPLEKLDIHGNIRLTGDIVPSACNVFNLGASNYRFKDLFLSGNTIDLGGTLITRDAFDGGIKVTSDTGEAVDTTVRNLFALGNIGIGTSAVAVKFEVHSTDAILLPKGTTEDRPIGVKGYVRYNIETNVFEGFGGGDAWGSLGGVKDTNQDTYIAAELYPGENDDALRFVTCNVQQMTIDKNGNVGIGTSYPKVRLDVNGGFRINQNGSESIADFQSGGSSVMIVNQTGRVGINTSPGEALHVHGNVFATGNVLAFGTVTASNLVILGDYVTLDTITSNTEQMVITNAGTGPALVVTQTGPQPIADFYDDDGVLALRIADGGNVGIGTNTPSSKLHVIGDIYCSGDVTAFSDARFKTDLKRIENALEKVNMISGYTYKMVNENGRHAGLLAQELQQVLPEVVKTNDDHLSVAYGNICALLVEAIKEISIELIDIKNKQNKLMPA